jgi:hypothetical protein
VLKADLVKCISIASAVYFFLVKGMVRSVAVSRSVKSTGIGVGSLVESLKILSSREIQV